MGDGPVQHVPAYLDTNVTVSLAQGTLNRITQPALELIDRPELLVAPMVLVELEYLFEVGRLLLSARDLQFKLEREVDLKLCGLPFPLVANVALGETWTRDPFDRLIVA